MMKLFVLFNTLLINILAFLSSNDVVKTSTVSEIAICNYRQVQAVGTSKTNFKSVLAREVGFDIDSTKSYSMPLLMQTPKGEVLLSWTEKNTQGINTLCMAISKDKGKTFEDKKVIYSGTGVGNSRLMRAKILAKKDGSLVAIFSNRAEMPAGSKGRAADIVYCISKDAGNTWTSPQSVDSDPTKGLMRGFFDAVLMNNGEIAVAYLKDVKGSTKHEERDLRMVITQNGVFQPEKLIDPIVCDCCNINLLVESNGTLNVYYRDNNDDIRDIAQMTSSDNGISFSKSQIIHHDAWKIMGCPHNGAVSSTYGKHKLLAWFSGAEKEPGIRLLNQANNKLTVLSEPSAKNQYLVGAAKESVMLWEQKQANTDKTQLFYKKINTENISETKAIAGTVNATNATGLIIGNQLLVANEVKQENKKNGLHVASIALY